MKKSLIFFGSILAIVVIAWGVFIGNVLITNFSKHPEVIGSSQDNFHTSAQTTVYTVGPSTNGTVTLAATSTGRTFLRIVSTSTNVYVGYNGGYSATNREPLSSPLVFDLDHMYTGTIKAAGDTTSTVSVTTFTR